MAEHDTSTALRRESDSTALNRPLLAGLMAVATAIGVVPYALLIGRFVVPLLLGAALAGLVFGYWNLRKASTLATTAPSFGEVLLGGIAIAGEVTAISALGWGAFWIVTGLLALASVVVGWVGIEFAPTAESWSLWVSLPAVILGGLAGIAQSTEQLAEKLYPNTAGVRSPFYSLLHEKRRLAVLTTGALVALVVLVLVFPPPGRPFAGVLIFYLAYLGASLGSLGEEPGRTVAKKSVVQAVQKSFTAAGYELIFSPRTGREDADPFVTTVDLVAHSPARAWVIEVKAWGKPPVQWHEASRLRKAARVLQSDLLGVSERVDPLMIIVARGRAEGLDPYLHDEPLEIVELTRRELIQEIIDETSIERLRRYAAEEFGVEPVAGVSREPAKEAG